MSDIKTKRKLPDYILGDSLSLKISSYPTFLNYLSSRIGKGYSTLLELCTGLGIGLIFLESIFDNLYGVELDPEIVKLANRNIENANLTNKVRIIQDDVNKISNFIYIKPDIVIYDIPYWFDHGEHLLEKNPNIKELLNKVEGLLTKDIIIYSPPHYDRKYYQGIFENKFEIEKIFIDGEHDRNVLYFGALTKNVNESNVYLKT